MSMVFMFKEPVCILAVNPFKREIIRFVSNSVLLHIRQIPLEPIMAHRKSERNQEWEKSSIFAALVLNLLRFSGD